MSEQGQLNPPPGGYNMEDMSIDFVFDEHQLSSDLEKTKLHDGFGGRGAHGDIKLEPRTDCYHHGNTASTFTPAASSNTNNQQGMFAPHYATTHIKSEIINDVAWTVPAQAGSWRPCPSSLSEGDLEADEASFMPHSAHTVLQPQDIGFKQQYEQLQLQQQQQARVEQQAHLDTTQTQLQQPVQLEPHCPYEEKQMRFEDEKNVSVGAIQKHQAWQTNAPQLHHQQQYGEQVVPADDCQPYTFELDELGEGPLHILSAVTDKQSLAKNLHVLVECDVVKHCVNLQNKYKQTPLFLAVQQLNLLLIGWLLDNGADPSIQGIIYTDRDDYVWRSPLHMAVMLGDQALPVIRLLLAHSQIAIIDLLSHGDKLSALHLALKNHQPHCSCKHVIIELLDRQADTCVREQSSSKTPFMMAIETRDLDLVKEFLQRIPADRRRKMLTEQTRAGDTCLHLAAGLSRMASPDKVILLRLLVTNGAEPVQNNVKEFPKDFARYEWNQLRKT